jgi:hypothetical protein
MVMKKIIAIEVFGSLAFAIVFSVLGYIALSEGTITTGDPRTGVIHTASGNNAIMLGLFFLALGFSAVAYLLRYTKYQIVYWTVLAVCWAGLAINYRP